MSHKEIQRMLERGLGSKGKIRILITLARNMDQGFSKYMLERLTGIRSKSLSSDLSVLVELKWVIEEKNHTRKYYLNLNDEIVKEILNFFRKVGAI